MPPRRGGRGVLDVLPPGGGDAGAADQPHAVARRRRGARRTPGGSARTRARRSATQPDRGEHHQQVRRAGRAARPAAVTTNSEHGQPDEQRPHQPGAEGRREPIVGRRGRSHGMIEQDTDIPAVIRGLSRSRAAGVTLEIPTRLRAAGRPAMTSISAGTRPGPAAPRTRRRPRRPASRTCALGSWRWTVRQRMTGVRDALVSETDAARGRLAGRPGRRRRCASATRCSRRLTDARATPCSTAPRSRGPRGEIKRLIADVAHHLQRLHDLAYDEVEIELGGSE